MRALALTVFIFISTHVSAQLQQTCGIDYIYKEIIANNPSVLSSQQQFNLDAKKLSTTNKRKLGTVSIIPVVFHVLHNAGTSNISDAQIEDAVKILNEDFRRLNASATNTRDIFKGVAADMEIEFRLARKDPNGNCTNGIVRMFSEGSANGNDSLKRKSYWPSDRYLNIWVVTNVTASANNNIGVGFMGYTQYPWVNSPQTDGIMVMHTGVGSIGTSNANSSKMLTHEAGHWLGCLHTFGDGCTVGDSVADTPPCEKRSTILGCDTSLNTCTTSSLDLPDQIENYMDFTISSCQNMFTIGQKARMETTLLNWRPLISSLQNLIATGTDKATSVANCAPIAGFVSVDNQLTPLKTTCTNTTIEFKDDSYNYSGTINYQWFFEGGTPSTSTQKNPTVSYNQIGSYDVTLIVSNANGTDSLTIEDYIAVTPKTTNNFTPLTVDFENFDLAISGWNISSNTTSNFRVTDVGVGSALPNNSKVLFANNNRLLTGSYFNFTSPSCNLSTISAPVLSFLYAAKLRLLNTNGLSQDALKVYYSVDCGKNWRLLFNRKGTDLATIGPSIVPLPFVPSNPSQWQRVIIPLSPSIPTAQQNNVKFRFQFESHGGDNFFLDAINIGFPTSVQSITKEAVKNLNVYPNPSKGSFTISLSLTRSSPIKITLSDVLGKELYTLKNVTYTSGNHSITLNTDTLKIKPGVYFLNVAKEGEMLTQKIIITQP